MKCVMFIHFSLGFLNDGKSGVQMQLENEIDLMSSLGPGAWNSAFSV